MSTRASLSVWQWRQWIQRELVHRLDERTFNPDMSQAGLRAEHCRIGTVDKNLWCDYGSVAPTSRCWRWRRTLYAATGRCWRVARTIAHFRREFTLSNGEELQSEYFVARTDAEMALRAVVKVGSKLAPQSSVSEVRTLAADTLWLSPTHLQGSVAFHFTWKQNWQAVEPLHVLEHALAPFAPRPHWGKLFVMEPGQIASVFPRMNDFRVLRTRLASDGKFQNPFVTRALG